MTLDRMLSAASPLALLRKDERGVTIAWAALGIGSLLGIAALTIDMGYMYVLRNQMQTTVDAAVSAGVVQLPDANAARTAAQNYVEQNMPSSAHGTVMATADFQVGNWNGVTKVFTVNGLPTNAVRATARRDTTNSNATRTFFASILGDDSVNIATQATAVQKVFVAPCLLALDPASDVAFTLDSNAIVDLTGCGVTINSTNASALTTRSNAEMAANNICVAGGYEQLGNSTITPTPYTGCDPLPDPLAGLALPSVGACNHVNMNIGNNSTVVLNPGVYCGGIDMDSNAVATLNPGIYVMKDGPLHTDSNTVLSGDGVLIFLTGTGTNPNVGNLGAVLDLDSNSIVDLKAAASGTYGGVVVYQNPAIGGTHRINSNSNKIFEGVIYLPQGDILVDSNGVIASTAPCTMLIARRFHFDSNAGIEGVFDLNPNTTTCSVAIPEGLQSGTTSTLVR
jgi:hypothetical protein